MTKVCGVQLTLVGLVLAVAATFLAPAQASADTPRSGIQWPWSPSRVVYRLSHAETVQIANDPTSVLPICRTIVDAVEEMVSFSNTNLLTCGLAVPDCVADGVQVGAQSVSVVFAWNPLGAGWCLYNWDS